MPIVSLLVCADEQDTACTAFFVHFADGDVPLAVVLAVIGPGVVDGSMLKVIDPLTAVPHVFPILAVTPVVAGIVAVMVVGAVQVGQLMVNVTD